MFISFILRLLEADREMARRKEVSRLELEARRMKRDKRALSPDVNQEHSVVELSDESPESPQQSDEAQSKSPE